jgi:flagellar motility protein MotE (MotC chaperone)
MTLHLPAPRLLPVTIAVLAALLAVKTIDLARYAAAVRYDAGAAVMAQARAATPDTPPPAAPAAAKAAGSPTAAAPAAPSAVPASPSPASPSPASPSPSPPLAISEGERAILLDLRQRRQQLDARDAALAARESILAAAEQKLEAQAQALTALQKKLQDLEDVRTQREEAGWQGLVKLYEDMKPRDAATIFNDLDMPVLLAVVDRMKELKAAPILAAMNPDKARDVTTGLARLRTHRQAEGTAPRAGG